MPDLRLRQSLEVTWFSGDMAVNSAIVDAYLDLKCGTDLKRSHYFAGRYENVYLDRASLPLLAVILDQAMDMAKQNLGREQLKMGFWFNEMHPGDKTTLHSHDDDDELLSAVYYLRVPENSGRLHLLQGPISTYIEPEEGMYVFFDPFVDHEVEENRSDEMRLSLAMNFGPFAER